MTENDNTFSVANNQEYLKNIAFLGIGRRICNQHKDNFPVPSSAAPAMLLYNPGNTIKEVCAKLEIFLIAENGVSESREALSLPPVSRKSDISPWMFLPWWVASTYSGYYVSTSFCLIFSPLSISSFVLSQTLQKNVIIFVNVFFGKSLHLHYSFWRYS